MIRDAGQISLRADFCDCQENSRRYRAKQGLYEKDYESSCKGFVSGRKARRDHSRDGQAGATTKRNSRRRLRSSSSLSLCADCFYRVWGTRAAFITFYPAVTLAALYGGLRSGLIASFLSAALVDYVLLVAGFRPSRIHR